jgi:hypothetical protein
MLNFSIQDGLLLTQLEANGEADEAALVQLVNLFGKAESWIDGRVADKRNMRLGRYYMSASALDNDEALQNSLSCARSLIPMLASLKLEEVTACH